MGILINVSADDPVKHLNESVSQYVQFEAYNEFIDANMDNPWVRVIIKGMDKINQVTFDPETHRL